METNKTVQFVYNFQNFDGQPNRIEHSIVLPYRGDVRELAHEVVSIQMDIVMKMLDAHEGNGWIRKMGGGKHFILFHELRSNLNDCRIVQTFENIH